MAQATVDSDSEPDDGVADDHGVLSKLDGFLTDHGLSEFSKKMAHQWLLKAIKGQLADTDRVTRWVIQCLNSKRVW